MKLLFDSNVIVDALTYREGSVEAERKLLYSAIVGEIDGIISAKQMTDIYYVLRKYIPESYRRRDFISIILDGFEVIPVDKGILKSALESEIPDYEDAVIDTCAERCGTYAIITNDKSGFQKGKVKALLPKEAVAEFGL